MSLKAIDGHGDGDDDEEDLMSKFFWDFYGFDGRWVIVGNAETQIFSAFYLTIAFLGCVRGTVLSLR